MEVFIEKGPSTGERSAPNGQRTRLSNGDDAGFAKDRDRSRLQINQARPTLSAVGRVASRVRTSGISKISTLLQNGKEEVENISASPWGVGEAAMARSQSTSVLARGLAKSTSTMRMKPSLERSESTVHMKSPLAKSESSMNMKSPIQRSKNTTQTNSALSRSGNIAQSDSLKRKKQLRCFGDVLSHVDGPC